MLFFLELTLTGLGGDHLDPKNEANPTRMCPCPCSAPHVFCGPSGGERLGLPQTPLPSTAPHKVSSNPRAPPFSGEPCGWARACGESHPSIILVTDRHEADGDNIPSQLPTDESPSRCRPEASGFFSLRNISVPTQWLNVAARVRLAHICASSPLPCTLPNSRAALRVPRMPCPPHPSLFPLCSSGCLLSGHEH